MRDAMRLVRGAVSDKDLVPVLTHFAIHAGRIHGYNGRVHLSAPVPDLKRLSLTVEAERFLKAIDGCGEAEPRLTLADGRLTIAAPPFTAMLPVGEVEAWPLQEPEPKGRTPWGGALIPILRALRPFIATDASKTWACGIWASSAGGAATNNISIAIAPLPGWPEQSVILPIFAVDELLRIGEEPTHLKITSQLATFWLPGGAWMISNLVDGQWPKSPMELVKELHTGAKWVAIPSNLREALDLVKPFCADAKAPVVILEDGALRTEESSMSARIDGFPKSVKCAFRVEALSVVLDVATQIDWSKFPRVPWRAKGIRGAIVGTMT